MHAYLVIGSDRDTVYKKAQDLGGTIGQNFYEFTINKIDEVRELSRFLKLSFDKPTTFLIKDVHEATIEALNAFLKNLEEPQENVKFILTTTSEHKVIPTIVSRCQIIRIRNKQSLSFQDKRSLTLRDKELGIRDSNIEEFLKASIDKRFLIIDSIRKREEAKEFVHDLTLNLHKNLISGNNNFSQTAKSLKTSQQTLNALNSNANIVIQLTNLAINL